MLACLVRLRLLPIWLDAEPIFNLVVIWICGLLALKPKANQLPKRLGPKSLLKLKRPKPPRLPLVGYMLFVPNAMNRAGLIISFAAGQGVKVILARQNSSCHYKMI